MCLRKYILNYFGQETEEHCGNCSNCLEEFVELDVGEIAADVIECVRESRQRYGMTMILSTLTGANTAKIRSAGMNELSIYGRQSKCSQQRLKDVVYTLLEHGIPSTERRSLCDPETDRPVRRITEIERIETSLQEVRTYRKEKVRKWKESVS